METITVKENSKIAIFIKERKLHKDVIKNYINGNLTLEELKKFGVKLEQPIIF